MSDEPEKDAAKNADEAGIKSPRIIQSHDLFHGDRMIIIRHDTEDYRLQITARGKLILTK